MNALSDEEAILDDTFSWLYWNVLVECKSVNSQTKELELKNQNPWTRTQKLKNPNLQRESQRVQKSKSKKHKYKDSSPET